MLRDKNTILMILFKEVIAEGIGSIITRTVYNLGSKGLTLISGENGAGKTTIFNVLAWVLYKKLLKAGSSLEPWEHIKPEDYTGMYGGVVFEKEADHYQIIRVQGFKNKVLGRKRKNALIIIKNGVELPDRDKVDNQTTLIEILGYSFDLFKSTILFGQELKRMMGEDGPTKKKILEETFDASFINKARDEVIRKNIPIRDEYSKLASDLSAQTEIHSNLADLIKEGRKQKAEFNEKKELKIQKLQKECDNLEMRILNLPKDYSKKLSKAEKEKEALEAEYDFSITDRELKLNLAYHNAKDKVERLEKEAEGLRDKFMSAPKKCEICGNEIPYEKREQWITDLKNQYREKKTKIFNLQTEAATAKKAYEGILGEVEANKELRDKIANLKSTIQRYKNEQDVYEARMEENVELRGLIRDLKDQIKNQRELHLKINLKRLKGLKLAAHEKVEKLVIDMKKLKKQLDINEWLIDDPLSNTGLKAMIFDTMLSDLNKQLKQYTKVTNLGVRVFIDLKSANKNIEIAVMVKDHEVLYNDLSGGQKQLVDVVLLFANNDVVYKAKPINVLLLDEVFERLSKRNIEIVSEIIQTKAEKRSLHLITHLSTFAPIASKKIFVELDEKGHTKLNTH